MADKIEKESGGETFAKRVSGIRFFMPAFLPYAYLRTHKTKHRKFVATLVQNGKAKLPLYRNL